MKLTKKLFITIMTMALLVVTFSASTFAWFTLGQTSEISNINVKITAGAGMEISTDGKKWTNNLQLADNTVEFIDLTSANGILIKDLEGNTAKSNITAGENEDKSYFETVFYVRITKNEDNADFEKVTLASVTGNELVFGAGTEEDHKNQWLSDADFGFGTKTFEAGKYYSFDALNALKISFEANKDNEVQFIYGYESDDSQGIQATDKTHGLVYEYAKEKDYESKLESAAAPAPYAGTYITYKQAGTPVAVGTDGLYQTVTHTPKAESSEGAGDGQNAEAVLTVTDNDFMDNEDFIEAYATGTDAELNITSVDENYLYAKLTVRIWLEGWDADCINAILDQGTLLSFVLKAE